MATDKIARCSGLFSLLGLFHLLPLVNGQECLSPLGMENGAIKDSQIIVSSVIRDSMTGGQARLRQNIKPWGAWCPNTIDGGSRTVTNFDEFIQIDLLNLTKVTRVGTQGRQRLHAHELVKEYKISYSQDNRTWIFYRGKDHATEAKIFQGNKDVSTVVVNDLTPTITVRYIRIHPGYMLWPPVCMRLELYGCKPEGNEQVILSYSMPVGQGTKNWKIQYKDTSYTGIISSEFYQGGTGILTDGKFGPVNAKELKGEGWVGWSSEFTPSQYIPITFEFSDVRKFKDVTFTVNIDKICDYAGFNRSRAFFSLTEDGFSNTSFLQYCTAISSVKVDRHNTNITLSLCENTAKYIKVELFFGGGWLLITEISFSSAPASKNENQSLQKCSGETSHSCSVDNPATVLPTGITRAPSHGCTDCLTETTPKPGLEATPRSSNLPIIVTKYSVRTVIVTKSSNTPIIVSVVVFLFTLLVIVFGILKYKRRHRIPQMSASVSIPREKVDLRPNDFAAEPSSNNQEEDCTTPATSDLERPYEEVQIIPVSVYTELDRNKQGGRGENDDHAYQKLLKSDPEDVVVDDDGTASYEEVKRHNPPDYTCRA